jgi:hypothetical protein
VAKSQGNNSKFKNGPASKYPSDKSKLDRLEKIGRKYNPFLKILHSESEEQRNLRAQNFTKLMGRDPLSFYKFRQYEILEANSQFTGTGKQRTKMKAALKRDISRMDYNNEGESDSSIRSIKTRNFASLKNGPYMPMDGSGSTIGKRSLMATPAHIGSHTPTGRSGMGVNPILKKSDMSPIIGIRGASP